MNGHVDTFGHALLAIALRASSHAAAHEVEAWIDTGFNGELVLPQKLIGDLALPQSGTVKAILADGSEVVLQRYVCLIEWFGEPRELEVVANDGVYPLLGVGLLANHDLYISYRSGSITIK